MHVKNSESQWCLHVLVSPSQQYRGHASVLLCARSTSPYMACTYARHIAPCLLTHSCMHCRASASHCTSRTACCSCRTRARTNSAASQSCSRTLPLRAPEHHTSSGAWPCPSLTCAAYEERCVSGKNVHFCQGNSTLFEQNPRLCPGKRGYITSATLSASHLWRCSKPQ